MESRPNTFSREKFIVPATALLVMIVFAPVVIRGAPLADDFNNCLTPIHLGLDHFLASSWDRLEMVRLARFPEILLTTGICRQLPFGLAIAIPASLTIAIAFALAGLLRDQGLGSPWPELGGMLWLLQPLGTESALWPAALHVPLGLLLALAALRLHHRGRHGAAVVAILGACFSVEQVILALPAAAWLTCRKEARKRAVLLTLGAVIGVLILFAVWHGDDPRLQDTIGERLAGAWSDPWFFIRFAGVGLGAHSIPLASVWTFPVSALLLLAAGAAGWYLGPRMVEALLTRSYAVLSVLSAGATLIILVNIPVILAVEQQGSPRVFAPTWLVLAGVAPAALAGRTWNTSPALWAAGGLFVVGALLSLILSVSVRVRSADFVEHAAHRIARHLPEGANIALCGVRRTVVEPAPRGAFSIHEFVYEWAAQDAVRYYAGARANFRLAGELWDRPCPGDSEVDERLHFDRLVREWSRT